MNDLINGPPLNSALPTLDQKGDPDGGTATWTNAWANWFTKAQTILFGNSQRGLTAERPTDGLWIGRQYFDATLGYPIWVQDLGPPVVWADATGTPV